MGVSLFCYCCCCVLLLLLLHTLVLNTVQADMSATVMTTELWIDSNHMQVNRTGLI
jgi:hypothetical protein